MNYKKNILFCFLVTVSCCDIPLSSMQSSVTMKMSQDKPLIDLAIKAFLRLSYAGCTYIKKHPFGVLTKGLFGIGAVFASRHMVRRWKEWGAWGKEDVLASCSCVRDNTKYMCRVMRSGRIEVIKTSVSTWRFVRFLKGFSRELDFPGGGALVQAKIVPAESRQCSERTVQGQEEILFILTLSFDVDNKIRMCIKQNRDKHILASIF